MNTIRFRNDLYNIKKHLLDEKVKNKDPNNYHIDCSIVIIDGLLRELEK